MAKTLQEKLAAAVALVAKYEQAIASEAILLNVEAGNRVDFNFGRGEKKRVLSGVVVAVKDDEKLGKIARIQTGDGFDAQFYNTRVADITVNHDAPVSEGEDPLASE
jgi:hypothetical protein